VRADRRPEDRYEALSTLEDRGILYAAFRASKTHVALGRKLQELFQDPERVRIVVAQQYDISGFDVIRHELGDLVS